MFRDELVYDRKDVATGVKMITHDLGATKRPAVAAEATQIRGDLRDLDHEPGLHSCSAVKVTNVSLNFVPQVPLLPTTSKSRSIEFP